MTEATRKPATYELHDVSRFPFVTVRSERCTAGFATRWGLEMDALLAGDPFVVAFEPASIVELPEDYRLRALWFKQNRTLLAGRCAAMVVLVTSADERAAMQADLAKRSRGFDVPYLAMESFDAAATATAALIEKDRAARAAKVD